MLGPTQNSTYVLKKDDYIYILRKWLRKGCSISAYLSILKQVRALANTSTATDLTEQTVKHHRISVVIFKC